MEKEREKERNIMERIEEIMREEVETEMSVDSEKSKVSEIEMDEGKSYEEKKERFERWFKRQKKKES